MTNKEKINILLKKKQANDELNRILDLHKKIEEFLELKPIVLDRCKAVLFGDRNLCATQNINYFKKDFPGSGINIQVKCDELLFALRDFYERRIIALAEGESQLKIDI
jgi:hypothetical protein